MTIAMSASVTVSTAEDRIGMSSAIPRVTARRGVGLARHDIAFGRNQQDIVESKAEADVHGMPSFADGERGVAVHVNNGQLGR